MATLYQEADETYVGPPRRNPDLESEGAAEERRRSEAQRKRVSIVDGVEEMRKGKLPTNNQINEVIDKLIESKSIETNKHHMSHDGKLLLKDFQELLLILQHALKTKNRDELFQSMIYHVGQSEPTNLDMRSKVSLDLSQKVKAKKDKAAGGKALMQIAKLFLFNGQFRSLLEQILTIAEQAMGGVLQTGGDFTNNKIEGSSSGGKKNAGKKIQSIASNVANAASKKGSQQRNKGKGKRKSQTKNRRGSSSKNQENESASEEEYVSASEDQDESASDAGEKNVSSKQKSASRKKDSEERAKDSESRKKSSEGRKKNSEGRKKGSKNRKEEDEEEEDDDNEESSEEAQESKDQHQKSKSKSKSSNKGSSKTHDKDDSKSQRNASKSHDKDSSKNREKDSSKDSEHSDNDEKDTTSGHQDRQQQSAPSSHAFSGNNPNTLNRDFHAAENTSQNGLAQEPSYGGRTIRDPSGMISSSAAGYSTIIAAGAATGIAASSMNASNPANFSQRLDTTAPSYVRHTFDAPIGGDPVIHARLNAAVPKYAPNAKPSNFEHLRDGFAAPVGGDEATHRRLEASVPRHADAAPNFVRHTFDAPIGGDPVIHERLNAAVPKYAPNAKPSNFEHLRNGFAAPIGGDEATHRRLEASVPRSAAASAAIASAAAVAAPAVTSRNASLPSSRSIHSNPAAIGAGYYLSRDQDVAPFNVADTSSHITAPAAAAAASAIPASYVSNKLNTMPATEREHQSTPNQLQDNRGRNEASHDFGVASDHTRTLANERIARQSAPIVAPLAAANLAAAPLPPAHLAAAPSAAAPLADVVKRYNDDPVAAHARDMAGSHASDRIRFNPTGQNNPVKEHSDDFAGTHVSDRLAGNTNVSKNKSSKNKTGRKQDEVADEETEEDTDEETEEEEEESDEEDDDAEKHASSKKAKASKQANKKSRSDDRSIDAETDEEEEEDSEEEEDDDEETDEEDVSDEDEDEAEKSDKKSKVKGKLPGKNDSISAGKIVNKVKQKAGMDADEDEDDEDSISGGEIIQQLKEILTTVQKNPEYQNAISTLMSLFKTWSGRLKSGQGLDRRNSADVPLSERIDYYKATAAIEAKTILEDWAQGRSLDPILSTLSELGTKLKEDEKLHSLFEKIGNYIQKLLQEPGYLSSDKSTQDGNKLVSQVRDSTLEDYKPKIQSMIEESSGFVRAISDDPISPKIAEKLKSIHNHLWYDKRGRTVFKPQLLNDMRITLLPALIEQIKFVPLPRITYIDKQFEMIAENLVLQGDTLMPDVFEVKADDYLRFSPTSNKNYQNSQSLHVHMCGINTTMEDVVFCYKRKTGFPKISDSGVISIATGGTGFRISLRIVSSSVDEKHTFRIDQCHCHVDDLNIKVKHSNHNTLYKVFNPMMTGIIKRQMCNAIEEKIVSLFEDGDARITTHLMSKKTSHDVVGSGSRRPGLFAHLINLLNDKIASSI